MWWIVTGVLVLGMLPLVVSITVLSRHVRPLRRAVHRLSLRDEQVQRVHDKVTAWQPQVAGLQQRTEEISAKAERLRRADAFGGTLTRPR